MRRFAVLAIILLLTVACGKAKPATAPAAQGNQVIAVLQDLSSFYAKKNLPGFMSNIADSFKDRKAFAASLQDVFSKYEAVQFTIQYSKMVITIDDRGIARATFNWDSGWEAGGTVLKNSGRALFVFDGRDGKLAVIEGKNPFIPQALDTQGKPAEPSPAGSAPDAQKRSPRK